MDWWKLSLIKVMSCVIFSVAKQTAKRQKAELEATTSKLTDMETLVSSKVRNII